jgi:hypothetical protein
MMLMISIFVCRTVCHMDDLIDADYELSKMTQVSIVVPTTGDDNLLRLREVRG